MAMGGPRPRRLKPPPLLQAKPRRRPRVTEVTVAMAALLLSGSAFLINAGLYLRGSEIAVLQPDHVFLYRDSGPYGSELWMAAPAAIINAARPDYGDVVTQASVAVSSSKAPPGRFRYGAVVEPVASTQVDRGVESCALGARCIPATGFYAVERPARLLDVPGGSSRFEYLAFQISDANCDGAPAYCATFNGFDAAVRTLRAQPALVFGVRLRFHFDGNKILECRLPAGAAYVKAVFDYLETKGWASVACAPASRTRGFRFWTGEP